MAAVGDLLRISQFFKQGTNIAAMVSFWRYGAGSTVTSVPNSEMAFDFAEQWAGNFSELLHGTAVYYRTLIEVAPDFMEFGENVFDRNGTQAGDAAPAYVSIQVKQNVSSRITRGGFKRLPFVSENAITGNGLVIAPALLLTLTNFYGEGAEIYNDSSGDTFELEPIVVGRLNIGTPEAPNYVLDWTRVNDVTSASCVKNTHQNSRSA